MTSGNPKSPMAETIGLFCALKILMQVGRVSLRPTPGRGEETVGHDKAVPGLPGFRPAPLAGASTANNALRCRAAYPTALLIFQKTSDLLLIIRLPQNFQKSMG